MFSFKKPTVNCFIFLAFINVVEHLKRRAQIGSVRFTKLPVYRLNDATVLQAY